MFFALLSFWPETFCDIVALVPYLQVGVVKAYELRTVTVASQHLYLNAARLSKD